MNLLGEDKNKISLVMDPFKKDKVVYVDMCCYTNFSQPSWEGIIKFRNGMTEGRQSFKVLGLENLHILIKQMQDFMDSL